MQKPSAVSAHTIINFKVALCEMEETLMSLFIITRISKHHSSHLYMDRRGIPYTAVTSTICGTYIHVLEANSAPYFISHCPWLLIIKYIGQRRSQIKYYNEQTYFTL
jgi:hypothetical protein